MFGCAWKPCCKGYTFMSIARAMRWRRWTTRLQVPHCDVQKPWAAQSMNKSLNVDYVQLTMGRAMKMDGKLSQESWLSTGRLQATYKCDYMKMFEKLASSSFCYTLCVIDCNALHILMHALFSSLLRRSEYPALVLSGCLNKVHTKHYTQ